MLAEEATKFAPADRGDSEVLTIVRHEVKDLLTRSGAFRQLALEQQSQIAQSMAQVSAYLVAPEGIKANMLPGTATVVAAGPDVLHGLVEAVDFPNFVADLIRGVFQAIVDASIQQMNAFGELMKNISETVSAFLKHNITDDDSHRFLATTYPEYFELDSGSNCSRLQIKSQMDKSAALRRLSLLPVERALDTLDQREIADVVVVAARRRLAALRQQLLTSMVLMGINRIIVTDGNILHR